MVSIDEFAYDLPDEQIAQTPAEPRDSARLLDATGSDIVHRAVDELPSLIRPGDVVVVNDTRVIPARLALQKETGGAVEVFLLEPFDTPTGEWRALVRPSRRVKPGSTVFGPDGTPAVVVGQDLGDGVRVVHAATDEALLHLAARLGTVPLPPYITAELDDAERYQTIYARNERSVAAPTAGLHLTDAVLAAVEAAGAAIHTVELAVGLGTFRPILVDDIAEHEMHGERFLVDPAVVEACMAADRVIAIGTTTVRALESAATFGIGDGTTELFISPGYEWKLVDVLFTNFHQPRSSLLVMLAAFAGERWRDIYTEALAEQYRFLSFGDAMIVSRQEVG
ncbi:MAG: tRNA preQ1(34) S-adenosylmethionine ribosyltransferase-isomerase QueA [Actinomycetota bacterium]